MEDDRELTMDEMDAAGIDNIDPTREYPVMLSHLSDIERKRVERLHAPVRFIVHWTDFVANEWSEVVEGPYLETDFQLRHLEEAGQADFGMQHFVLANDKIQPTLTADHFFNQLDWEEWLGAVPRF